MVYLPNVPQKYLDKRKSHPIIQNSSTVVRKFILETLHDPTEDVPLKRGEFIAKESFLHKAITQSAVTLVDGPEECIICQVLRAGPKVHEKTKLCCGKVIILRKCDTNILLSLTRDKRVPVFIQHEDDIRAFIKF